MSYADFAAGIDLLTARVHAATERAVEDTLKALQAAARWHTPIGVEGNSTNAPGELVMSIAIEGPFGGGGVYHGSVAPHTIYAAQREFGGPLPIYQVGRLMRFVKFGEVVYRHDVYQEGAHYMAKGYRDVLPSVEGIAAIRISLVISET
jgi:hypothetical protein